MALCVTTNCGWSNSFVVGVVGAKDNDESPPHRRHSPASEGCGTVSLWLCLWARPAWLWFWSVPSPAQRYKTSAATPWRVSCWLFLLAGGQAAAARDLSQPGSRRRSAGRSCGLCHHSTVAPAPPIPHCTTNSPAGQRPQAMGDQRLIRPWLQVTERQRDRIRLVPTPEYGTSKVGVEQPQRRVVTEPACRHQPRTTREGGSGPAGQGGRSGQAGPDRHYPARGTIALMATLGHARYCPATCSFGWCWFVLREKYYWLIASGWFVYCWQVVDKPSEQGADTRSDLFFFRERERARAYRISWSFRNLKSKRKWPQKVHARIHDMLGLGGQRLLCTSLVVLDRTCIQWMKWLIRLAYYYKIYLSVLSWLAASTSSSHCLGAKQKRDWLLKSSTVFPVQNLGFLVEIPSIHWRQHAKGKN
jgi:cytochrome c553